MLMILMCYMTEVSMLTAAMRMVAALVQYVLWREQKQKTYCAVLSSSWYCSIETRHA